MSRVLLFEYEMERMVLPMIEGLSHRANIDGVFLPGESVAIKIHPGEPGDVTYLRHVFVHKMVEMVKSAGASGQIRTDDRRFTKPLLYP